MVQVRVACVSVGATPVDLIWRKVLLHQSNSQKADHHLSEGGSAPAFLHSRLDSSHQHHHWKNQLKTNEFCFYSQHLWFTTISGSSLLFFPLKWPLLRRCSPTFSLFSFTFEQCITRTKCFNSRALKGLFVVYFEGRPSRLV